MALSMFKAHTARTPGEQLIQEMSKEAEAAEYGVATRVVLVDPELAGDLLATNFANNRNIRQVRVDEYARQMKEGQWTLAESAICFDTSGRLVNGQHRTCSIPSGSSGERASNG